MRWIVHTIETWVHVEASPQLTLTPTLHWRIWEALRPGALHSSSSCSLFRLASIRSSSSSSPSPRILRLLSRWSFQPPLESTGPSSPPAFTSATYKEKLIVLDFFFFLSFFPRPAGHTLSAELTEPCSIKREKKPKKKKTQRRRRCKKSTDRAGGSGDTLFTVSALWGNVF